MMSWQPVASDYTPYDAFFDVINHERTGRKFDLWFVIQTRQKNPFGNSGLSFALSPLGLPDYCFGTTPELTVWLSIAGIYV
jgi:hypothetical protein